MSFEAVPTQPGSTLWEGELVPNLGDEPDGARSIFRRRLDPEELAGRGPVVTIGTPEVLRALKPTETPGFAPVVANDIYLVRLWCSFVDPEGDLRFERGHFNLTLSSSSDPGAAIVARDMHPTQVLHKVKRDVNVGLTPEVTFAEVGVKLGSFSYGFAYDELQPTISAAGQGEATPTWTFASAKALRLQGGKAMHLLVAAPEGTASGEAELELRAYVTKPGRLPLLFERHAAASAEPLKVRLW